MIIVPCCFADGSCKFTVWAPNADTVAVKLLNSQERIISMQKQAEGYWQVIASDITPGTLYFYQLNGEIRPDPVSNYQPQGVHGPSQISNANPVVQG